MAVNMDERLGRVSGDTLTQFSDLVSERLGLHFPRKRHRDLLRGVRSALADLECPDEAACVQTLLCSNPGPRQLELLATHLTIGETYFYRERKALDFLAAVVVPDWRKRRGRDPPRIWSAACATGEEPYSIAMALDRCDTGRESCPARILATDLNPRFLERARRGVYTAWSFRGAPPSLVQRYFRMTAKNEYALLPRMKERVAFELLNLVEDDYPSLLNHTNAMDVIFCRNALIYFSQETRAKVLGRLARCLTEGGWFIVGATETSAIPGLPLTPVVYKGVTVYRKEGKTGQGLNMPGTKETPPAPAQRAIAAPALAVRTPSKPRPAPARAASEPASPGNEDVYAAALALFKEGQFAGVTALLERVLPSGKAAADSPAEQARLMTLMARACANQGELDRAASWCKRAVDLDKLNASRFYLLSTILHELGRSGEEKEALQRVLYMDPHYVLAHFSLGNLALAEGLPREAARCFGHALDILAGMKPEEVLEEAEGLTAGRLAEIIESLVDAGQSE